MTALAAEPADLDLWDEGAEEKKADNDLDSQLKSLKTYQDRLISLTTFATKDMSVSDAKNPRPRMSPADQAAVIKSPESPGDKVASDLAPASPLVPSPLSAPASPSAPISHCFIDVILSIFYLCFFVALFFPKITHHHLRWLANSVSYWNPLSELLGPLGTSVSGHYKSEGYTMRLVAWES